MGREMYGRETNHQQTSDLASLPRLDNTIAGTAPPLLSTINSIRANSLIGPGMTRPDHAFLTSSIRSVYPAQPSAITGQPANPVVDHARRIFLGNRIPDLFRLDPRFELTKQHVTNFLRAHSGVQWEIETIKHNIRNAIFSWGTLSPAEVEEAFVVLHAMRDLEQFISAVSLAHAFGRNLSAEMDVLNSVGIPSRKPEVSMYPPLRNQALRNQLEAILNCANNFTAYN